MALNTLAYNLDGASHHAKLSPLATLRGLSSFTWMAWVKPRPMTTLYRRLYMERQGVLTSPRSRFSVETFSNKLRFVLGPKDNYSITNYDVAADWSTDRWRHIAFIGRLGENPTYTTFLDGLVVAEGTLVRPVDITAFSDTAPIGSIYVGNSSQHTSGDEVFPSTRYWDGKVDEIIIFNEAKSEGDILTYVASDDTWDTADTSMLSYWQFEQTSGTQIANLKNAAWTGTTYVTNVITASTPAMRTTDRPFLGDGLLDTEAPTVPVLGTPSPTFDVTATSFGAVWGTATDNVYVQSYELQVSLVSNFASFTSYDMGVLGAKIVTGLIPNTNYYWRVRAFDAEGNAGGYQATQSLTTLTTGDLTAPSPPTALVVSQVTHNSFRLNFTASASSDETGYKLDVATDRNFDNYLTDYRNRDIGNVTQVDVVGAQPLTSYFVRLRAYDAAANEGIESDIISFQTLSVPDTTPPLPVETLPASGVLDTSFIANWQEGIDDIGVSSYRIDLATDTLFTEIVSIGGVPISDLNVGNVRSFLFTDLTPTTTYYYRVRAMDGGNNVSQNTTTVEAVTTDVSLTNEEGLVETAVAVGRDATLVLATPTTPNGTSTEITVSGSGAADASRGLLYFDLTTLLGSIQRAELNLFVRQASADPISINVLEGTTFTEATVTWNTQPTVSGSTITFTPLTADTWVTIDITSLFLNAIPTTAIIKISTISTDVFTFDAKEGTNASYLSVQTDPTNATDVDDVMSLATESFVIENYIKNPSFEDNTLNLWTTLGGTVTVVASTEGSGSKAAQIVGDAGAGIRYSTTEIASALADPWSASMWVKVASSTTTLVVLALSIHGADALGVVQSTETLNISFPVGRWRYIDLRRLASTIAHPRVSVALSIVTAGTHTILVDAVALTKTPYPVSFFDGNSSGASWSGTVNASTSRLPSATIVTESTYSRDGNNNNSVVGALRATDDDLWLPLRSSGFWPQVDLINDRTLNKATLTVGPTLGSVYNLIKNPSFENNLDHWSVFGLGVTLSRTTERATKGSYSCRVTTSTATAQGVESMFYAFGVAGSTPVHASADVYIPAGVTARLAIRRYSADLVPVLQSSTSLVSGISSITGDNAWHRLTTQTTTSNTEGHYTVLLTFSEIGYMDVDSVLLHVGATSIHSYLDGDMPEGMWLGAPHASATGYVLRPERLYQIQHTYTDTDGIVNVEGLNSYAIAGAITAEPTPDNATTADTLILTPQTNSIDVLFSYIGDDNEDNSVVIEWKRTDLSGWTTVHPTYHREDRNISATIDGLRPGTEYTVRVTTTDADAVYGANPLVADTVTTMTVGSADTTPRITFDGFVLMGRSDAKIGVVRHEGAFGHPERRVQVENLPRVDGGIELQNLWGSRRISLSGFVEGSTRAELEDNKNALKRALAPKQRPLVIDTLSRHSRYFNATCESLLIAEEGGENIRHLYWDAEFICADPFSYDSSITLVPEIAVTTGQTITFNNNGDLRIDPLVRVRTRHGHAVSFTLTNVTTGERITPSTTIINGDRIIIDTARLSLTKNGIDTDYSGSFPHLVVGANLYVFDFASSVGTPTLYVEAQWRQRYL